MGLNSVQFNYLSKLLGQECAIVLEPGKEYLAELRLGGLATKERYESIHDLFRDLMQKNPPELVRKVVNAMTTNETLFFRDLKPYQLLQQIILPELEKSNNNDTRRLNIWSAACATGQEPYSLAMMMHKFFPVIFKQWAMNIIATDISFTCLDYAKKGVYNQFEVNRGLPIQYLVSYFSKEESEWALSAEIKNKVGFKEMNLIKAWGVPPMDIIFLRNVLIYFDLATKKAIFKKIKTVLKPGGYLFLGSAETTLHIDSDFEPFQANSGANCYVLKG